MKNCDSALPIMLFIIFLCITGGIISTFFLEKDKTGIVQIIEETEAGEPSHSPTEESS